MLEKIKSSIIPLTIAAALLIFSSQALAVDRPKTATPPGKLTSCQTREAAIKNRMTHLTQLAQNMSSRFDRHATRVEKYYTTKLVPKGKTVANYDALVADINAKKADVQTALSKVQSDVKSFSCANGDPKLAMTQFRKDMQTTKQALKDYRTAVKNLIVAVHTAAGGKMEGTESGKMKGKK